MQARNVYYRQYLYMEKDRNTKPYRYKVIA